jgi:hypothetical protein
LLHVQSKACARKAALHPLHDSGHDFFIFFKSFPKSRGGASFLRDAVSYSASARSGVGAARRCGKPLADVPHSC